MEAENIKSSK